MNILLVGGGTGGPVSPLLAIADEIKKQHPKARFLLVGSKSGPEKLMAQKAGIEFVVISSGKLRRYFSLQNFIAPFFILAGFFQSLKILKSFRPDCIFGTGSFVQVPVVWAGKILSVPVVLHQQDVVPGLANRLCQFAAKKITVTFEASLKGFASGLGIFYTQRQPEKIVLTGNPFREELRDGSLERAIKFFGLKKDFPTLLVLGGGTGAEFFNKLMADSLPVLAKTVQIIHSTGQGKLRAKPAENYHPFEFISNMADAYAAADIVFSRCGLSTVTELSNLQKLSIIVPMPDSPQEINALFLTQMESAIVLNQNKITPAGFTALIRKLLFAPEAQQTLKSKIAAIMPKGANRKIAEIILKLAEKS